MATEAVKEGFSSVRAFVVAARETASLVELRDLLLDTIRGFEIDNFLMAHHVDFGRPAPGCVQIGNYPPDFVAIQRERGGWRHDPVLLACEKSSAGFFWSDVDQIIRLTDIHLRRFEDVKRYGVCDGFVVPNHVPGELSGSVHFTVAHERGFPRHFAPALQSLAAYGFEAARRLAGSSGGPLLGTVPLTDRQIECVLLAARGKSDTDIAQLLGLRPRTVNEYIEGAKRRYCVATRQQLIVRALFNSQITFSEVLH